MNSLVQPRRRGLHLVTANTKPAAAEPEAPPQEDKEARRMAEAILQYQTLQDEFEAEVLSRMPDQDRVTELIMDLSVLRKQLLAEAERVRP